MRLVTYRRGRAAARVGALADDVVFDLAALAADRASEQGAVRRGRGGFPKTMLALIQGGTDAWNEARQALDHGLALLGREGLDRLAERRLASPLRSEERRVGKECKSRWEPHSERKSEKTWTRRR